MKPTKRYIAVLVPSRCERVSLERSLRNTIETLGGLLLLTCLEVHVVALKGDTAIIKVLARGQPAEIFLVAIALTKYNGAWLIPISTSGSIKSLRKNLLTSWETSAGDEVKPSQAELGL